MDVSSISVIEEVGKLRHDEGRKKWHFSSEMGSELQC